MSESIGVLVSGTEDRTQCLAGGHGLGQEQGQVIPHSKKTVEYVLQRTVGGRGTSSYKCF